MLALVTLSAVASLLGVLFFVDPFFADSAAIIGFYLSLFLSIGSISAWIYLLFRARISRPKRPMVYFFMDALRRGAVLSGVITASLFLQDIGKLSFFSLAPVVGIAVVVEVWGSRSH